MENLLMVFIDPEEAYNIMPMDLIWWVLDKGRDSSGYIDIIKDLYGGAVTKCENLLLRDR